MYVNDQGNKCYTTARQSHITDHSNNVCMVNKNVHIIVRDGDGIGTTTDGIRLNTALR